MNRKTIKHCSKMGFLMVTVVASWLFAIPFAAAQPASHTNPKHRTSDQVFKNVQVLKGIPVDDFLGTMGIMCAALGFDCSECHTGAGTEKVDWAADNPRKLMARRMIRMMTAINHDNFGDPADGDLLELPSRPRSSVDHPDHGEHVRPGGAGYG